MMKVLAVAAVLLVPLAGIAIASGRLVLNPVFTDNMVIQRGVPVEVYGTAGPGSLVTVELAGKKESTKTGRDGRWAVVMGSFEAGGPYEMTVAAGSETVRLKETMIGDVWFCSGQSNMEWPMKNTDDGAKELGRFRNIENVRLFKQSQIPSPRPLENP